MEDPVREIPTVIKLLTQSPPVLQQFTIEKFFTPSASFSHPFCRTWSFNGSRWLIIMIYRFYKIMSPRIDLKVNSVAFDESHLKLYVTLSQLFSIFPIPFYLAPVTLTTVLTLTTDPSLGGKERGYSSFEKVDHPGGDNEKKNNHNDNGEARTKYYIASQEDLYQTTEFVKFFLPFGIGVFVVFVWHLFATAGCVLGAIFLWPITWFEERTLLPLNLDGGRNVAELVGSKILPSRWRGLKKEQKKN